MPAGTAARAAGAVMSNHLGAQPASTPRALSFVGVAALGTRVRPRAAEEYWRLQTPHHAGSLVLLPSASGHVQRVRTAPT